MAVFKLTAPSLGAALIVRARCITCARQVAVGGSPADEVGVWRNPALSSVDVVRNPERLGYWDGTRASIIERVAA